MTLFKNLLHNDMLKLFAEFFLTAVNVNYIARKKNVTET